MIKGEEFCVGTELVPVHGEVTGIESRCLVRDTIPNASVMADSDDHFTPPFYSLPSREGKIGSLSLDGRGLG